ncbi:MAG: transcription antitermination protein NusB [Bacteroidetes bacterium]|nr:transcription antitermination protein NusB [Bacteroidota bacterium]
MQALYGYFQHENANAKQFEKDMFKSLDKIYELYLTILSLLNHVHHTALVIIDENKNKKLPTQQDLNPNLKFVNNFILLELSNNKAFADILEKRKINWQNDFDLIRKLFFDLRASDLYKNYMQNSINTIKEDKQFLIDYITEQLSTNEVLLSLFEDKNLHWADDAFVAFNSVVRNLDKTSDAFSLLPLLKDEKDDLEFMSALFNRTIMYKADFKELIGKHTKNWELERIANMDMLLMEMALTEIMYIPTIPIKASLNEYIDISKEYSTPQSKLFLNGVLDNVVNELKRDNKINKIGKGLKEE